MCAGTGIEAFVEKETTATTFITRKTVGHISQQANVSTRNAKEGTESFVDTTTHKKDALEEKTANTSAHSTKMKK